MERRYIKEISIYYSKDLQINVLNTLNRSLRRIEGQRFGDLIACQAVIRDKLNRLGRSLVFPSSQFVEVNMLRDGKLSKDGVDYFRVVFNSYVHEKHVGSVRIRLYAKYSSLREDNRKYFIRNLK